MSFTEKFVELVTLPVRTWTGYDSCTGREYWQNDCYHHNGNVWAGLLLACIIWGILLGIMWCIFAAVRGIARWAKRLLSRQPCSHCGKLTNGINAVAFSQCRIDAPCCENCGASHPLDAAKERMQSETPVYCPDPSCGAPMSKMLDETSFVVADVCAVHGVFLTHEELQLLRARSFQDGHSNGYTAGYGDGKGSFNPTSFLTGFVIGGAGN